jgi:hypothetical protein
MIRSEPDELEIVSDQVSVVSVSVYAEAWGKYFDSIEVRIHSIPTFHLPVYVEVLDSPVCFTFAPDLKEPTLR